MARRTRIEVAFKEEYKVTENGAIDHITFEESEKEGVVRMVAWAYFGNEFRTIYNVWEGIKEDVVWFANDQFNLLIKFPTN